MSWSARSTTGDGSDKAMDMAADNTPEHEPAPATADGGNDSDSNGSNRDPTELPFLVTHWLSTLYNPQGGKKNAADTAAADTSVEQKEAMDKIRRATADLASAFSTLGAFGTASRPQLGFEYEYDHEYMSQQQQPVPKVNATFADLKRKWSTVEAEQLDHLVGAAVAATVTADVSVLKNASSDLVQASAEVVVQKTRNPESGRTLSEAVRLDGSGGNDNTGNVDPNDASATTAGGDGGESLVVQRASSSLQLPVRLEPTLVATAATETQGKDIIVGREGELPLASGLSLPFASKSSDLTAHASNSIRRFLDLRNKCRQDEDQIRSLQNSMALQEQNQRNLDEQRAGLLMPSNNELDPETRLAALDEIKDGEQNCKRTIATLQRQLGSRERVHGAEMSELVKAEAEARGSFNKTRDVLGSYRDPFGNTNDRLVPSKNRVIFNIAARQLGIDRLGGRGVPRSMGRMRTACFASETRKALLYSRLSHAATVNTHLSYPVYCLRFDRTGQYFVTGADDYLVKVFSIGGNMPSTRSSTRPSAFVRGPVLVCTLRGHAGVINDIDVSSDNGLLATASEDGDCRVWGLKDGCPVAILRGHVGGANMVAWSKLTPYRLVTTGADGLARTWDIRAACLKRYAGVIGTRPEYRRREQQSERSTELNDDSGTVPLLPLPLREGGEAMSAEQQQALAIPIPPLPPAVAAAAPVAGGRAIASAAVAAAAAANGQNLANRQNERNGVDPGSFVANDEMDEGVKLVAKLQHGAPLDERAGGPGTRARRLAVKVICVARCPHGGHFATGSDDGICRVWQDDDDPAVEATDKLHSDLSFDMGSEKPQRIVHATRRQMQADRLLLTLKGHLGAITDLMYSQAGNRILTASQKDGVVRIWSWGVERAASPGIRSPARRGTPGGQSSYILIKLVNPNSSTSSSSVQASGRRPKRSSASMTSCDVAVWVQDDTKIVTSQCELAKQNTSEVVPGSQFIFLWDSYNGNCLLGISEAHGMQCPVVIPHPTDPSIICSAGADGYVKLWDWETGRCMFSHKNTVDFGPVEARDRGKISGYLEGAFFPDGTGLVLTDDCGRISFFDTHFAKESESQKVNRSMQTVGRQEAPTWMKEQYFANDYYELFYDSNGYCIERGSEQPPHLAPRGVRCSHSGAPWSDAVNAAFKSLSGPLPVSVRDARSHRQLLRSKGEIASERNLTQRGNIVGQYDPQSTILIRHGTGEIALARRSEVPVHENVSTHEAPSASESRDMRATSRLSNNYRWRDYVDLLQEEANDVDEPESDDEDFELQERRVGHRSAVNNSDSDDDDDDEDLELEEEEEMPSRASDRVPSRRRYAEVDSDEDAEYLSTNNAPSGPFVVDYDAHFFRMSAASAATVQRKWLRRVESNSSYGGRKSYIPQVGDSVVYIPRAHYETIAEFPSLPAPWQSWPVEAVWPVVRCCIRSIRYRFPYMAYFNQSNGGPVCKSVVAILLLELTGIPQLSHDSAFGWPKPSFIIPSRSHTFELSMFENDQTDFVIPMGLYTARIESLERALSSGESSPEIEAYYAEDGSPNDSELTHYKGVVKDHSRTSDDLSGPNLCSSGYRSLVVEWEDGTSDVVSPWEVNVCGSAESSQPSRPSLTDEEKKSVFKALAALKDLPGVEAFMTRVDERRYSDYASRIEIPMDLTFITNRLEADYYATRFDVVADVKLIRENCAKYNGVNDDLTISASGMLEKFEGLVLSDEERQSYHDFEAAVVANIPQRDTNLQDVDVPVDSGATRRSARSQRQVQSRSSLEDLPDPQTVRIRMGRSERRPQPPRRIDPPANLSSRSRRSTRSILEIAPAASASQRAPGNRQAARAAGRQLSNQNEQLDNLPRRGRSLGQVNAGNTSQQLHESGSGVRARTLRGASSVDSPPHPQRHSARTAAQSGSYVDQPSEPEDSGDESDMLEGQHIGSTGRAQSSRKRSSKVPVRAGYQDTQTEGTEDSDDSAGATGLAQRSLRRSSRAPARAIDKGSNIENMEESEDSAGANDRGRPSRRRPSRAPARARDQNSDADDSDDSGDATRLAQHSRSRPSRAPARAAAPDSDIESNEDSEASVGEKEASSGSDEELVVSDEDDSDASSEPKKRASQRSSPSRSGRQTYADPSSSEFGSDVEEEYESKAAAGSRKRKAVVTSKSKKVKRSPASPPSKKRKGKPGIDVSPRPALKDWPIIALKSITDVTLNILKHLRALDEDNLFDIPVVEAYPSVADDYSKVVSNPMDFRTIEEERLQVYRNIAELQQDLILIFDNCIEFNGAATGYGEFALLMLNSLESVFRDVCKELDVSLPRRW